MRAIAVVGLAVVAFAATAKETVVKPQLIRSAEAFSSAGVVSLSETELHTKTEVNKVESGQLNGVSYHFYYTDGSGRFAGTKGNTLDIMEPTRGNWSVRCNKDTMDDSVDCSARLGSLAVLVKKGGGHYVFVGSDHYPGTDVAIRLGDSKPLIAAGEIQFGAARSEEILLGLKNGMKVSTRYQEWPNKYFTDEAFELYGFEEVYAYLQWAAEHAE